MTTSQYDVLAQISERLAEAPLRKHYEEHVLFQALGTLQGRSVLDLACGTGLYARRFKQRGAARVLGMDSSEGMIAHARRLENEAPLGIEYLVGDAAVAHDLGAFDAVAATYLLHYAPTRAALTAMCRTLRAAVAPGGRVIAIVMSPDIHLADPGYYHPYGFEIRSRGQEGDPVVLSSVMPGMPFEISARYWSRATYEQALEAAGLCELVWHEPAVSGEGIAAFGEAYWQPYLRQPHAVVLSCRA